MVNRHLLADLSQAAACFLSSFLFCPLSLFFLHFLHSSLSLSLIFLLGRRFVQDLEKNSGGLFPFLSSPLSSPLPLLFFSSFSSSSSFSLFLFISIVIEIKEEERW
eukprot:Phypoly_transcript_24320.p1 GENE.Phypoly_transcript_24320~~Phypoly_transcript_24320.p1  ORF type:complete len:106 (+),score=23.44 Phypoly_transcript_24320:99-416(+)